MISKGTTHNNGAKLAAYMTTGKEGERADLWELRGFGATNIKDAFRDVQIMSGATKCEQPFFHVQVRNREGEIMTRQQFEYAADRIERMLGLSGQPRAITFHTYEHNNDQHMHVAWSRIDQETMTAKPLPFFKERLKKISRELELHFGLEPVTNHREGNIKFAPTRAQDEQARRLGQDPHELRNTIRELWDRSDCGRSFQGALEHEGFTLAQGERRDFVVIDRAGGLHVLGKRILDMTAAKIRDRLSDLSRDDLPTVGMARAMIEPEHERAKEKQPEKREPVWDRDRADRDWQNAVIEAAIDREKIDRTYVEPAAQERRAGAGSRKEKEWPIRPPIPEPVRTSPEYHFEDAARQTVQQAEKPTSKPASKRPRPKEYSTLDKISSARDRAPAIMKSKIKGSLRVGKVATRTVGKTLDAFSDAFASLFAPVLTPEQIRQGEKAQNRREAEADSAIDFARYTSDMAQQCQQQENEREAERQRARDRGTRDR